MGVPPPRAPPLANSSPSDTHGVRISCVASCAVPILRNLRSEPELQKNNFSKDSLSYQHFNQSFMLKKGQIIRKSIARIVRYFLNTLKIRKKNTYCSKSVTKNQIASCCQPFWSVIFCDFKYGLCLTMQPWQLSENEAFWRCPLWPPSLLRNQKCERRSERNEPRQNACNFAMKHLFRKLSSSILQRTNIIFSEYQLLYLTQ